MQNIFEKIIDKLEEEKVKGIYDSSSIIGEKNVWAKAIEIVKQEAEQYEECYKDCGDCEAYNKEKYHCPKFCKVIKETVKEIEENHNDWIPCSERLPEDGETYLVTNAESFGQCHTYKGWYDGKHKIWHMEENFCRFIHSNF